LSLRADRFRLELASDKAGHAVHRVEIGGHELLVGDRDAVALFEERDQLEHPGGIDDAAVQKGRVVGDLLRLLPE
jgi:hypothetical protein